MRKRLEPKKIRAVFLDADGVLVHGNTPHPGAIELLDWVRSTGRQLYVLTNNSSVARSVYAARWRRKGFHIQTCEIITSAYVTARYFARCLGNPPRAEFRVRCPHIFVVGGPGIAAEFQALGVRATLTRSVLDPRRPNFVIAGIDRRLNYAKIARAQRAIRDQGAMFIATNQDPTYPTENGFLPGAGVVVAAIATAAERQPDVVVGKPYPLTMEIALATAGCSASQALMVGDRLDTDIRMGKQARVFSVLVLTGATTSEQLGRQGNWASKPDRVLGDVSELRALLSG